MLEHARVRRLVHRFVAATHGWHAGSDSWALVVEARGADRVCRFSVKGRGQAEATAEATALLVELLVDGRIEQPGVCFAEQVVEPARFFEGLRSRGLEVTASEKRIL